MCETAPPLSNNDHLTMTEPSNGTDEAQSSPQNPESESEPVVEQDVGQASSLPRFTGTLKCFSQRLGYGFVLCDETGENLLIPTANIMSDTTDLDLSAEWPVEFEIVEGPRGLEASGLVMLSSWPEKGEEEKEGEALAQPVQQEQQEVFEYDNVQVNETNPEPLLVEEAELVVEKKKTGKELAVDCRVKFFNCKKWHGSLIREDDSSSIFVRLCDEAIESLKKKGILVVDVNQRVSVDLDWGMELGPSANDSITETGEHVNGQGKKAPPVVCTDLRLIDAPAITAQQGDLRRDLNAAKLKETNGTAGNGDTTVRQARRRREKDFQKRKMADSEKPATLSKKPTMGDNKPKQMAWRGQPKPSFGGPKPGGSMAMKRGPILPGPQRFGPQMPFGGGGGYGAGPLLSFRPPPQRGRSPPPPLSSQHPGPYYNMMPQYPQQQPPPLVPQRNPYGSPQRPQPQPMGRSVTMPSLMSRSMSPSRGGGGGGYGGGNALMNLYENAMTAASRLNPYQQRDMAAAAAEGRYRPPPPPPQQQQMRYFDPRASSYSSGGPFGQPPRRY